MININTKTAWIR